MSLSRNTRPVLDAAATFSGDSDYGSDIDVESWDHIFQSQSQVAAEAPRIAVECIEEPVLPQQDDADPHPKSLRLARIRENLQKALAGLESTTRQLASGESKVEIKYDGEDTRTAKAVHAHTQTEPLQAHAQTDRSPSVEPDIDIDIDIRSPLDRFRAKPKKPLSVTDIVSPAWCELQYWYSLTKYGRIRRTPAMKQGSKIHKEKQREVHTEVPVETTTREDNFGLRLWNIIQGLRTLRANGLTRELEVFGLVDGEIIVGIIDEVSYRCPDEDMENQVLQAAAEKGSGDTKKKGKESALPADQKTIADFHSWDSQGSSSVLESQRPWLGSLREKAKTIYLVDIKTRQSKTIPKLGSQMRATQLQLMLYRRLLVDLAANTIHADSIFQRYSVDPHAPFSDTFMSQLASFDLSLGEDELSTFSDEPRGGNSAASQHDPLDEILSHNTISSLWSHMMSEFARTISTFTTGSSSVSPLLTAEFRAASTGERIGARCFPFDAEALNNYVKEEMRWWRGERRAQGVEVEEAYKCRICEFSEKCEWRIGKVEEATQRARSRRSTNGGAQSQR